MLKEVFNTDIDKKMFIDGILNIITADGIIAKNEISLLNIFFDELDLINNIDFNLYNLKEFKKIKFSRKDQELLFLKEAITIAIIDGDYSLSEKDIIKQMVCDFNIDSSTFNKIESDILNNEISWLMKSEFEVKLN